MAYLVKRVNSRIEICEADKYDRERGNMWVLRFPSDQGAWLSRALSVEDMQALRAALDDSRFLPAAAAPAQPEPIQWIRESDPYGARWTARVLGMSYRIERDGRIWLLALKDGGGEFEDWAAFDSLLAAKSEVARLVAREVSA